MGVTPLAPQASASASSATFASGLIPCAYMRRGVRDSALAYPEAQTLLGGSGMPESEGVYLTLGELCKP